MLTPARSHTLYATNTRRKVHPLAYGWIVCSWSGNLPLIYDVEDMTGFYSKSNCCGAPVGDMPDEVLSPSIDPVYLCSQCQNPCRISTEQRRIRRASLMDRLRLTKLINQRPPTLGRKESSV